MSTQQTDSTVTDRNLTTSPGIISPSALDTTTSVDTAAAPPLSAISRKDTFEHKTSGSVPPATSFIPTTTPAINDHPVELEAVPAQASGGAGEERAGGEERGEGGCEKRQELLKRRSRDPSVIVDLPAEPTAEEVEAAKMAEGTVTPALGGAEFEAPK